MASAWSPDSTRLATGSADGTTKVWEVTEEGAEELFVLSGKDTVGGNIPVFSPDGTRVMTGDAGIRAVKVWDVSRTGDAEWSNFPVDPTEIPGIAFAPDGSGVVASNGDGSMTVWDPASGEEIRTLGASLSSDAPQAPYPLWDIDVSPDGRLIATTGEFETNVRDARAGAEVFSLVGPPAESVAWSPDGNALAAGIPEASHAKIVDRTGKTVALLQEDPVFAVAPVAFSRNGRLVATGLWPPPGGRVHPTAFKVRIWDWEREEIVRTIDTEASTLAFDPTGKLLGTGGFLSGLAEIWEVETGRKVATLTGHGGAINDMEFSPDGTVVATASDDGTVRLWDPQTGVERFELRGREGIVWHLAFSPDGSQLVSSSLGQARVWAVNLDDLIDLAEGELTRGLTNEECRQYLHVDRCPEK